MERAAASLDAGSIADAREALDEARELCPDRPEIAAFENLIATRTDTSQIVLAPTISAHAYDVQQQEVPAGWTRVLAAVAALIILFGLFGFGLTQLYLSRPEQLLLFTDVSRPSEEPVGTSSVPERPAAARTPAPTPTTPPAAPASVGSDPNARIPSTATVQQVPPARTNSEPETSSVKAAAPQRGSLATPDRERTSTPPVTTARSSSPASSPSSSALGSSSTGLTRPAEPAAPPIAERTPPPAPVPAVDNTARIEPPPTLPAIPAATDTTARNNAPAPVPALQPPPPAARPAASTTPRADEAANIRSVLARYETAYNKLDASGASSVWPSVDHAALDRAFKGLISQRVSLGLCDITVVGDVGGASCAGKARWEPKVGGGLQTADRHWTFNLRKTDDGWRIEQIRVR
jgi:hypothetical protein